MNRLLMALILAVVMVPLAAGQADQPAAVAVQPTTTTVLGPASDADTATAIQYVKDKLGEGYYTQYLAAEEGTSYRECAVVCTVRTVVPFDYRVPFEAADDPQLGGGPFLVAVTLDGTGAVTQYTGPARPYQFLIDQEMARERAASYGLKTITEIGLVKTTGAGEYEIVWAVSSSDEADCREDVFPPYCLYKGVYVDVDSGEIRGEFAVNPLIQVPGGGAAVVLGQSLPDAMAATRAGQPDTGVISAAILLGGVVGALLLWRWKGRK